MMKAKAVVRILDVPSGHWVGDGFPVRGMFGELAFTPEVSPFLLLDHAGPREFPPTEAKRGVGSHPHKGFETVTIVYAGEVEHRDSAGHHGTIGPGDVQWMTAGAGIVHEEFHSRAFAQAGGLFEMVQLWVNLPAADKKHPPRYQSIRDATIPSVALPDAAGQVRLIAGAYGEAAGPAKTFTPVQVWDVRLAAGAGAELPVADGDTTLVFVLRGEAELADGARLAGPRLAVLERAGEILSVRARDAVSLLVLSGRPIDEPIAARGPFVMNTEGEIRDAMREYQAGGMGSLG
jgi:hypothetical protein